MQANCNFWYLNDNDQKQVNFVMSLYPYRQILVPQPSKWKVASFIAPSSAPPSFNFLHFFLSLSLKVKTRHDYYKGNIVRNCFNSAILF